MDDSKIVKWECGTNIKVELSLHHYSDMKQMQFDFFDYSEPKIKMVTSNITVEVAKEIRDRLTDFINYHEVPVVDLDSVRDPTFTGGLDPVTYLEKLHSGEL